MTDKKEIKHIVILALPKSTLLSIAGPLEVFNKAIEGCKSNSDIIYKTHIISIDDNTKIDISNNLSINAEASYNAINYPIDTLIVAGISEINNYEIENKELLVWINEQAKTIRRICSICTGAFVLAKAGILSNKKATTHWQYCAKLAKEYPDIIVEISPYFTKDGNIYTSAGISSGMDLALALIEQDMDKIFALQIAKQIVLFLRRPGNQLQYYSSQLTDLKINNLGIRKVCEWIINNLKEEITVELMADYAKMSPRNFARVFAKELAITPAKYISLLRVEYACKYILETEYSLEQIAEYCGAKSAENLRRLFISVLNTTPNEYRKNFNIHNQ